MVGMLNYNSKFAESPAISCGLSDGIMRLVFKGPKIDLPEAKEAVKTSLIVAAGGTYPYLIDIAKVKNITKEARAYFSIKRYAEKNIATAILAPNLISKLSEHFS